MIYKLLVASALVASTSAVSIKSLQKRTRVSVQEPALDFNALPTSFLEAGYEDETFHSWGEKQQDSFEAMSAPVRPQARQVITKFHKFEFYDHDFQFEPQYDDESPALVEVSTEYNLPKKDIPAGEDYKVSPHGRTNDVNDPDYEINHPTDHKHSKNVIGTKQEGHLFWTDTVQPNPDTYESTSEEAIRTANTVEADDQAFSQESTADVEDAAIDISCDLAACEHTAYAKPQEQ